jgi:hypothetical protein
MCQDDLGESDVLTPFEDCAIDESLAMNTAQDNARVYANRVVRIALVLHELLKSLADGDTTLVRGATSVAQRVLDEESEAASRGGEA